MPILARDAAKGSSPREAIRSCSVAPVLTAVEAVAYPAGAIAPAIIVIRSHEMFRIHGILGDRRLVLRLPTTLQIRIAEIQAVLVDLDIRADRFTARVVLTRVIGPGRQELGAGRGSRQTPRGRQPGPLLIELV